MKERKFTKGGFEDTYPEAVDEILTSECPEKIALDANLTKGQWDCISHYLDNPSIEKIARELGVQRANVYSHLNSGFTKLEEARRSRG